MRRIRQVCAFIKISAEGRFKFIYPKQIGWNLDGHAPKDRIILNAWRCSCAADFGNHVERERLPVFTSCAAGGKHKASACRFEVEVLGWICGILQENFYARIFPAATVIFLDGGAVAIYGFFDGELYDKRLGSLRKIHGDHRVDDSLVREPFHVGF